ncbi:hypothetical protein NC653_035606 [Populus alba x Populus x berolinensis]|uniref:Uncharacterized protein n=1 Tax=Populus alba x Populus x berolinensis TaxID=444605 RepID=A0AAD6PTY1_9ROSI|nr:hypothetical protein NC653_035606 [Populus alba x Populus x berolinensis]
MGSGNPSSSGHLSPEGRVAKPIRRRSKGFQEEPRQHYSIQTPRISEPWCNNSPGVLVHHLQQDHQINATNFGYAVGVHRQGHHGNHPGPVMMPPGYHLQYHQQQQQQFQQQSQPPPPYMFSLRNSNMGTNTSTTTAPGDLFFQRLGKP